MSVSQQFKREARVALSLKAQPVWFRVTKWLVAIAAGVWLWRTPYFWACAIAALVLSLSLHLFWRWKTKGWTRPWGGWNDLVAGR